MAMSLPSVERAPSSPCKPRLKAHAGRAASIILVTCGGGRSAASGLKMWSRAAKKSSETSVLVLLITLGHLDQRPFFALACGCPQFLPVERRFAAHRTLFKFISQKEQPAPRRLCRMTGNCPSITVE